MTVSLVTFEGQAWLPGCLAALGAQELSDYELIAHDNGSRDASLALLEEAAHGDPRVRVRASAENLGFCVPHDRAIAEARGQHVLLLNQDVELDPGFLAAAVRALDDHPEAASIQGRVRLLASPGRRLDVLDTTGLVMARDRRAFSRARGQVDGPEQSLAGPVWGADGPAPVYRMSALWGARLPGSEGPWEVLDRDFYIFKEDVDLAWRLRRLGWGAWYEPDAVAWHARGTGDSGASGPLGIARANRAITSAARARSWRNQRLMQIKNEDLRGYLRDLPWIVVREALTLAFLVAVDPRALAAVVELVRAAPSALRKRRALGARIKRSSRSSHRWHSRSAA
ncbi:hypothetical protein BH23CHL8_BH23CHL8_09810 [soil metagenome]